MSNCGISANIYHSTRFLIAVWREINSLVCLVKKHIEDEFDKFDGVKVTKEWDDCFRIDDDDWVYTDSCVFLGVGKRNGKANKYINIQISLYGDGMRSGLDDNEEPLLHVSFRDDATDYEDGVYFSIADLDDAEVSLEENVLFNWGQIGCEWNKQEWTFSLKLTSINSIEDINSKIVKPLSALISGADIEKAGLKMIQGIVHYEKADEGSFYVSN